MNRVYIISAFLFFTLVSACKHEILDEGIWGPEYAPVSANFQVINEDFSASIDSADFTVEEVTFHAVFNERVSWDLNLRGITSGAEYNISGLSDSVYSLNSIWDGAADNNMFFRVQEQVVITLSFIGTTYELVDTVYVEQTKPYDGVVGFLIDDFDENAPAARRITGFSTDGGDKSAQIFIDNSMAANGDASLHFTGTDENSSTWMGKAVSSTTGIAGLITSTNPEEVYFNFYIYGTGLNNSTMELEINEDDNENGSYSLTEEDIFVFRQSINWVGWKLVSIPYSKFSRASNPAIGGSGNGVAEPQKISGIGINLMSDPFGASVDYYVDFVFLTEGGPFKP